MTDIISKLETQEGKDNHWQAESNNRGHQQAADLMSHESCSQAEDPRMGIVNMLEIQTSNTVTNILNNQGEESLVHLESNEALQPLTN